MVVEVVRHEKGTLQVPIASTTKAQDQAQISLLCPRTQVYFGKLTDPLMTKKYTLRRIHFDSKSSDNFFS